MSAIVRSTVSRRALLGLSGEEPSRGPERPCVEVAEHCLALSRVMCESCAETCDSEAIRFLRSGVIKRPIIDAERCTACEACIPVCPVGALSIRRPGSRTSAEAQSV